MLAATEEILQTLSPRVVVVYGDTNSTLAGALAAAKLCLPLAHVEAGLRSFDRCMPEEVNRVVTDHLSTILFAPTETAVRNLCREGMGPDRVRLVGDVMYDAALFYAAAAESRSSVLNRLGLSPREYVLATVHRAENTDDLDRLEAILQGLILTSRVLRVVLPLHPRTRAVLNGSMHADLARASVLITEPVGYLDMVTLERNAKVIATDSGGVQKEAFFYQWGELVELGWNHLTPPTSPENVRDGILRALELRGRFARPYGDGDAAKKIVDALREQCAG
jgi:UDP-GlcNAc3NAcA epimerase